MWNLRAAGILVLAAAAVLTFSAEEVTVGIGLIWLSGAGLITAAEVLRNINRRF